MAKKPPKEYDGKKTVYIRLDKTVYERIDEQAKKEDRSFSFVAARILTQGSVSA